MSNQIKHRKLGTETLVGLYYVSECIQYGWVGSTLNAQRTGSKLINLPLHLI